MVFWATEIDYAFLEGEGQILLTILVEKCGVNNNTLKEKVIEILKTISNSSELFPINKTTRLLMRGLTSKNSKTKAEVLHVIDHMIEEHQMETISEKDIKTILKLADEKDQHVRTNALDTSAIIYKFMGQDMMVIAKKACTPKGLDLITSRLK